MTETQWGVRSLRLYYPKTRANIASALEDLLILRGIQVTLVGDPQARDFIADSGRQTPFSFIFDPQRVFKDQPSHSRNRPEAGRYFLYITEELPRKGSGAHDALERIRIHELLRGALCVYTTFIQNIEEYSQECTIRVLPPPPVAFSSRSDKQSPRNSDIVFFGTPDARQQQIISRLQEKWRVRRSGQLSQTALSSLLSSSQVVVMPRASNARLLPVCDMSEIILSGAQIITETPVLERPRVYDTRVTYIESTSDIDALSAKFSTAVTSAMLGKSANTSESEVERVEMALLHVTHDALMGLGRPGPLPTFISAVRAWFGSPSIHAAIQTLCKDPGVWQGLKTRTLTELTQSIPPIQHGVGDDVLTVCLYTGDPDACVASIRGVTAAFPHYQHSVCCPEDQIPAVANALALTNATHVQIWSSPESEMSHTAWRAAIRTPRFWEKIDSRFALVFTDSLLLRSARLVPYMKYDLIQYNDPESNLHASLVNVKSMVQSLRGGPVDPLGPFIPIADMSIPEDSSITSQFFDAIFPSDVSVIPGLGENRPPGLRVALIDSFHDVDSMPGPWVCSTVMALLSIVGTQTSIFSAISAPKWVNGILNAWGSRRQLHGLACIPHSATEHIQEDEFDLIIDVAGARGPTLRRRLSERQWLMCMDPMQNKCAWWSPSDVKIVFDRVITGSVANYTRAQNVDRSDRVDARDLLSVVPVPHYLTGRVASTPGGSNNKFVSFVEHSDAGRFVAKAFDRAAMGPSAHLTILYDGDDPAMVAEIQSVCGHTTKVIAQQDEAGRRSILDDAKYAILVGDEKDMAASGGMPSDVLAAIQGGCIPLWKQGSPASMVLVDRAHGTAFTDQKQFTTLMKAAVSGATLMTPEGGQDSLGIISLHTPVSLRHALVSMILGGRGTIDTDLLGTDHDILRPPAEKEHESAASDFDVMDIPVPPDWMLPPVPANQDRVSVRSESRGHARREGRPPPRSRPNVRVRGHRRRRMGLGFQIG